MALSQSGLSELLEAFRAGDGVDLIRESVRVALQELIEAEATERIGAAPYERTESRVTERNGHRTRSLSTKAGDVDLRIPKLRKGSFFPVILEPRPRRLAPAVPGSLRQEPARPRAQVAHQHGRGGIPHDLRPASRRGRQRHLGRGP